MILHHQLNDLSLFYDDAFEKQIILGMLRQKNIKKLNLLNEISFRYSTCVLNSDIE